ncbi:MAG: cell division protein FtsL [Gammaproteobacteria bacterium]|nr:cell division protein FtsL [Gammaproteobacteria bacterium]MCP5137243.1 cell division protein FtsL [Gammaproteobacteria bacterium]
MCLASALALVYARFQSRVLFADSQALSKERDRLDIEWRRLQLEQGALATSARVERLARTQLEMRLPRSDEIVMVWQ